MLGSKSAVETLYKEVLSWPVINMLKRNHRLVKLPAETIPNEFGTWKEYKEAFCNPMLEEIWHQIDSGMDTISRGLYVHFCVGTNFRGQKAYKIKLETPRGNMPKNGDLMLLSARGLQYRDRIIKDGSFCAILVVMHMASGSMVVWLSHSPFGGKLNEKSSYQVMHLASLKTYESSWEVMMRGSRKSSELCNLILTKNMNGADGECGLLADKVKFFETARVDFGLNESQRDAVACCISATKCSEKSSVRLIWGPPGTGKTKTLSVILCMLLMTPSKPRILVCAPTNSALVQLASRLISLVEKFTETSHLLGNIIMFGSDKLSSCFKKTDNDLSKIFLKCLVAIHPHHCRRAEENKLLQDAQLVFCTPFQSIRLSNQQYSILVIDEAAYLKESESTVPLTIDGIKHLVLVGDEKQLQSIVLSPIAKEAKYGRSLFERLCEIGYRKHMLNVQYRMHPYISKFPNEVFYDGTIIDGTVDVIKGMGFVDIFIGHIFGNYSFINVEDGIEQHIGQSVQNEVEAAVAANIVARLSEACTKQNKKTSVGVLSLYAAQVTALEDIIGKIPKDGFLSVEVQCVDSFQGDEKDIIILSTVRNNKVGNIGFLNSDRRSNVALTRARNCLWILGDKNTLIKSKSIWSKLVQDATRRRCLFDAHIDLGFATVIAGFKDMNSPSPSECSQLDADQSSSGSKRSAEELQLPVPKKERTVVRTVSAGQVAAGESTCLPDQPAAEPAPSSVDPQSEPEVSSTIPAESSTPDLLLSAGMQIEAPLRDSQGPLMITGAVSSSSVEVPQYCSQLDADQSSSGSKRSAEELQLPVPKKKRTVARKASAGQVAAGESTRLPDQPAAEPAPSSVDPQSKPEVSSTIPAESSATDPLLSAGMQIEAPLRDLQGPLMITGAVTSEVPQHLTISVVAEAEDEALLKQANQLLARAESAEAKLVEGQKRCAKQGEDHLAAIAVLQEQVESLKEKNKKLSASLKERVQAEATNKEELNTLKDLREHTQDQVDQALKRVETLRTQLEAKRNMRHGVDSQLVAGLQQIRNLRTRLEMLEAQKEEIKVAATPILQLVSGLSENQASKPFLDQLRKVPDLIRVYCKKEARVCTLQVLGLVRVFFPSLDLTPVGEGMPADCSTKDFASHRAAMESVVDKLMDSHNNVMQNSCSFGEILFGSSTCEPLF